MFNDNGPATEKYVLNVPLIGQLTEWNGEQHGHNACWYAATTMVSYFFRQGPRCGNPKYITRSLIYNDYAIAFLDDLMAGEGFCAVPNPFPITPQKLLTFLKQYGPLVAMIFYPYAYKDDKGNYRYDKIGHSIVITGVEGTIFHYNEPGHCVRLRSSVAWLQANLQHRCDHCDLLYKDQKRY